MASWKKVLLTGLDLAGGDVTNNHVGVTDGTNSTDVALGNDITFAASGDLSVAESSGTITYSFTAGATTNSFSTISAPNGTNPEADASADTLTLTNGNGITITGDSSSDTIDIKVTDGGIAALQLAANAVTTAKIADVNVTTGKIADDAVTPAKVSFVNDSLVVTSASVLVSNGTDYQGVAISGDATITNAGVVTVTGVAADSVALGTDTTGNYASAVTAGANIAVSGAAGEGASFAVALATNVDVDGTLDVTGVATFDTNVVVGGTLTVQGGTTTIESTNLLVDDTFISLNDNATADADTGIVFGGAANKVFGWDQSQESGRFGVDYAGGDASATGGGFSPDAWVSVTHTNSAAPLDVTNGDIDALRQIGNIYVNSTNSDIYIWA